MTRTNEIMIRIKSTIPCASSKTNDVSLAIRMTSTSGYEKKALSKTNIAHVKK